MNLHPDDLDILQTDPEFNSYLRKLHKIHKHSTEVPEIAFGKRTTEVTQMMLGNTLVDFTYRVWLFSDSAVIFICNKCLFQCHDSTAMGNHRHTCTGRIPGMCIYNDHVENIAVVELDGENQPILCRRICIIGKAFIERKTVYLDVKGYLFYVLIVDECFAGFFSKEKESSEHNLSCLLVLPMYRSKGYAILLIDLSYILAPGSPEKPLSNQGQAVYRRYWKNKILLALKEFNGCEISIYELSLASRLSVDDVICALEILNVDPRLLTYEIVQRRCDYLRMCKKEFLILGQNVNNNNTQM
ncbi:acetyltransferase [Ordospora pajunii]|uniref:acetyltransferase n=1 Tax=Ordospora pajunii TaxID=3039483 RepID=UPI00295263BA|nr:acetyltransferase [Ordospora pajunii]KAH9412013.1 acetyltransferase [Ordospora pajunii]